MKSIIIGLIVYSIHSLCNPIHAFGVLAEKPDSVFISDIEKGWGDVTHVGNEIISASGSSILKTGIIFGSSIALMSIDQDMRDIALRNRGAIDGPAISFANEYGNLWYPALGTLATYGLGLALEDESMRMFARKTCASLLIAGGITTVFKSIIGRSRPFANEGSGQFTPFTLNDARLSFPSGHSTVAFVMSASLSKVIDRWWADILLYGLATGTAYARMHNDRHWLSDTVLGAAIGYYAVQWVYDDEKNEKDRQNNKMTFLPIIQPYSIGMMIAF